jgi:membrane associated rhomboid family serine protease
MYYICAGYAAIFIADLLGLNASGWFVFNWMLIVQFGQVWRLVTFIFVPPPVNPIFILFFILFYSYIGRTLERTWGRMKTTVFYFTGALLTLFTGVLIGIFNQSPTTWFISINAVYMNLSLFLAFATLYPNEEIRVYLLIPVKVKYLAYLQAVLYVVSIITTAMPLKWIPIVALVNYALYFSPTLLAALRRRPIQQAVRRTKFNSTVKKSKTKTTYRHRCAICGLTDADDPSMEFRYCSLCSDYPCYCTKHLFRHEHK